MTWAKTRALFGLDDVALKGLLSVKQSGSNAIERTAGIDATFPLPLAAAKARFNRTLSMGRGNGYSCPIPAVRNTRPIGSLAQCAGDRTHAPDGLHLSILKSDAWCPLEGDARLQLAEI